MQPSCMTLPTTGGRGVDNIPRISFVLTIQYTVLLGACTFSKNMNTKKIIEIAVILIAIAGVTYWFAVTRPTQQAREQVEDTTQAIEQVVDNTPSVAPETNPAAAAVPAVNPLEKTNPFKNEYENPFK